eukprot:TRINITY_DN3636_c0_g1_i1.p1 TRINITY_DN3636_c0_g1~~TRINITY_DN3636_c0_g1_i1.p1  ORF type:complete len:555 (+),score=179.49 TRINITY_DN3636_c0_g1_i1:1595-3259(+)
MTTRTRRRSKRTPAKGEESIPDDASTTSAATSHSKPSNKATSSSSSSSSSSSTPKEQQEKKGSANPDSLRKYWFPDRRIDMEYVKTGYQLFHPSDIRVVTLTMIPVVALMAFSYTYFYVNITQEDLYQIIHMFKVNLVLVTVSSLIFGFLLTMYWATKETPVYLLDFTVFSPPEELKISNAEFEAKTKKVGCFTQEAIDFQTKLLHRTGLGEETYFPPGIMKDVPETTFENAREEALMVFTHTLDDLFARTNTSPKDVDILIVNCSLFNPTPSLASMIINHYKMRSDIQSFNLAGMGCSAGVISISLAKDLLQSHRNCTAVVCSTENITQNWYLGNEKGMLISNTLFRLGGAAIMLSNKFQDGFRAKYELQHAVRTHIGADDDAFKSIYQEQDETGRLGVRLSKKLVDVLGKGVKANLITLGPLVLPIPEQLKFWVNMVARKYIGMKDLKPYVPDFKKCFDYYCIHAGGRAVIDGLQNNFDLTDRDCEPSRATLYRYGNVSSASIWYELAYIERAFQVKKGETVWQIAFGSGFMANSAIWKAIRPISDGEKDKK